MFFPVEPGEKYALIAISAVTDLKSPIDLGAGFFALPQGALELPDHWKQWLGTMRTEAVEKASLLLLLKAHSIQPEVLDAETEALKQSVTNFYWGLLASGRLRISGTPTRIAGANDGASLTVRLVGELRRVVAVPGVRPEQVSAVHVRRAVDLGRSLTDLLATPGMRRMKRAISTFLEALSEDDLPERIHQFVRAVDGLTRVYRAKEFRKKSVLFVGEEMSHVCGQLYEIRSSAEHYKDPDDRLEPLPPRDSQIRGFRRAHEAEALARYCLVRLVEERSLWQQFADDHIEAFWSLSDDDRRRIWGPPLDLVAAMTTFQPSRVPGP